MEIITGGVTAAKGFMAAGVEAGIKYQNRKDMAMVYSKTPCRAAGVFTTNVVKAAPVLWDKEVVESEWEAQAIVVNSGIANACTGKLGYEYCRETAGAAADALEISPQSVLICSTGVIGMQLPMEKMTEGVRMLAKAIKPGEEAGTDAAKAIMTTDTRNKQVQRRSIPSCARSTTANLTTEAISVRDIAVRMKSVRRSALPTISNPRQTAA